MGRLLCPKPGFLIIFKGFPIFRKTGERPGSTPLYIPYSPLWDALFPINSRYTRVAGLLCYSSPQISMSQQLIALELQGQVQACHLR